MARARGDKEGGDKDANRSQRSTLSAGDSPAMVLREEGGAIVAAPPTVPITTLLIARALCRLPASERTSRPCLVLHARDRDNARAQPSQLARTSRMLIRLHKLHARQTIRQHKRQYIQPVQQTQTESSSRLNTTFTAD